MRYLIISGSFILAGLAGIIYLAMRQFARKTRKPG